MPNTDSPATPITTITPNIHDHNSNHAISPSSDDLSIADDVTLYLCFALIMVVMGLASLVIPVFAFINRLERTRAKQNSN